MGAVVTLVQFKTVMVYSLAIFWIFSDLACADFVLYQLPGSQTTVLLEGKTKSVGPSAFEYTHPTMGTITLSRESANASER